MEAERVLSWCRNAAEEARKIQIAEGVKSVKGLAVSVGQNEEKFSYWKDEKLGFSRKQARA